MKKTTIPLLVLLVLVSCNIGGGEKCDNSSALWGEGRQRTGDDKMRICVDLAKDYIFTNVTRTGVRLSAVYSIEGGVGNLSIVHSVNGQEDIQDYDHSAPLRLTLQNGELVSNNPDFEITVDLGLVSTPTSYDTFELQISEKKRDDGEFEGYLKCSGKYLAGFSLGEQTFEFDLEFDTKN